MLAAATFPSSGRPLQSGGFGEGVCVGLEIPTTGGAHGVTHRFPAVAVTVEVAVLQLHDGVLGVLGSEGDVYLTGSGRVGLDLPAEVDVPAEGHTVGRLVDHNGAQRFSAPLVPRR